MEPLNENIIYARKLGNHELGYRRGKAYGAGGFIYISKTLSQKMLFFPPLSTIIENDNILLKIIPPNSDNVVFSNYVFHNSKIVKKQKNGRDEYRLYLNNGLNPRRSLFNPNDIVLIDRNRTETDLVYRTHHYPISEKTAEYYQIEKLMQRLKINRLATHAIIPHNLIPFVERDFTTREKIMPEEVIKEELDKQFTIQPPQPEIPIGILEDEFKYTNLIKENAFRELLLFFYDYKCSITGKVIRYKDIINLEAAHIIPDKYGGPRHPKNGLPLSRDLHWAFDFGLFTIKNDYTIRVHDEVIDALILSEVNGKQLLLPADKRAWPSEFSLEWHRENVFGKFLLR